VKVVVCKDEDADALLAKLRLKERELVDRFAQQDDRQRHASIETARGLLYVVVEWLQAQGFKAS
jgi:hypothetical protein